MCLYFEFLFECFVQNPLFMLKFWSSCDSLERKIRYKLFVNHKIPKAEEFLKNVRITDAIQKLRINFGIFKRNEMSYTAHKKAHLINQHEKFKSNYWSESLKTFKMIESLMMFDPATLLSDSRLLLIWLPWRMNLMWLICIICASYTMLSA